MTQDLDKRLRDLKEGIRAKERFQTRLTKSTQTLEQERERLDRLSRRLRKEEADVRRMEGLSLSGMFHQVLGSKDQKLDRERQEFLAAKLKYDECRHSISSLERDISLIQSRLNELGDPEAEYAALIEDKESFIEGDQGKKLAAMSEQMAGISSDIKELKEALEAGRAVREEMEAAVASLKKAKTWGVVDLVGGGLIITAVKHSKIDRANESVHRIQHLLRNFQRELEDVPYGARDRMAVEKTGFTTFADYFFDGLIFDWVVQSKINRSLDNVLEVKEKIGGVVDVLERQLRSKEADLVSLRSRRQAVIESA